MSGVKRFPVRLKDSFSEEIDWVIFHMNSASKNSTSKHQYILDAISEKMERDKDALKKKGIVYEKLGI
ncbi:hypothetical protein AAXB25_14480 [Paenibacillus lautus]|uniref:hypothetical protein n=1 Tax=Paenibacillus lautus TaxID=1401 RepID=UPI003D2C3162